MLTRKIAAAALLLGTVFATSAFYSAPAQAAIIPLGTSDSLVVRDGTGAIVEVGLQSEALEDSLTIITLTTPIDIGQFGNATVLQELDASGHLIDSDIFGIANISGGFFLAFSSDSETQGVNFGTFPNTFPEGNGAFDATMYLDPALRAAGWTAQFVSDAAVPEPATLALFGAGLAGLGVMRRRKARRNA